MTWIASRIINGLPPTPANGTAWVLDGGKYNIVSSIQTATNNVWIRKAFGINESYSPNVAHVFELTFEYTAASSLIDIEKHLSSQIFPEFKFSKSSFRLDTTTSGLVTYCFHFAHTSSQSNTNALKLRVISNMFKDTKFVSFKYTPLTKVIISGYKTIKDTEHIGWEINNDVNNRVVYNWNCKTDNVYTGPISSVAPIELKYHAQGPSNNLYSEVPGLGLDSGVPSYMQFTRLYMYNYVKIELPLESNNTITLNLSGYGKVIYADTSGVYYVEEGYDYGYQVLLNNTGDFTNPLDTNEEYSLYNGGNYEFYNLGKGYIYFMGYVNKSNVTPYADLGPSSITDSFFQISNIRVNGEYHDIFNNTYQEYTQSTGMLTNVDTTNASFGSKLSTSETVHEDNDTPPIQFGSSYANVYYPNYFSNKPNDNYVYDNANPIKVINLADIRTRVGNGRFKAGIWENGVWNSGWREDTTTIELFSVGANYMLSTKNNKWRIQLKGVFNDIKDIKIGSRVAISNIIGIDINEERKLLKSYFSVINVYKEENTPFGFIIVDYDNSFPLIRIEKDSERHKIVITENLWLNGAFLNGYFKGVWNNGLMKGFPRITKMEDTHWIDGIFDGGHMKGDIVTGMFYRTTRVSSPDHSYSLGLVVDYDPYLYIGDKIDMNLFNVNGDLNMWYQGEAQIIEILYFDNIADMSGYDIDLPGLAVDKPYRIIIVDRDYGVPHSSDASDLINDTIGNYVRRERTALVQHFKFYDNKVGSLYNSWIDLVYDSNYKSRIGFRQLQLDSNFKTPLSTKNHFNDITEDILTSESVIHDSVGNSTYEYYLGTKFKIYNDFIGESSSFDTAFNSEHHPNFKANGWIVYNKTTGNMPISSEDSGYTSEFVILRENNDATTEQSLYISLSASHPTKMLQINNSKINPTRKSYSITKFTILSNIIPIGVVNNIKVKTIGSINSENYINITETNANRREYTYYDFNNPNLNINIEMFRSGTDDISINLDNIKYYEVNMIPFFRIIGSQGNEVNSSIAIPFNGASPYKVYTYRDVSYIDNVTITINDIESQQTFSNDNVIVYDIYANNTNIDSELFG